MIHRPHWSYSAINQFLACPLRYYFQRVLYLPQPSIGSSLVLGSSVHAVLAEYHRSVQQDKPTKIETLHRVFADTWSSRENQTRITFKDGENPKDTFDQGIALIELYLKEPPPQHIIGIETDSGPAGIESIPVVGGPAEYGVGHGTVSATNLPSTENRILGESPALPA